MWYEVAQSLWFARHPGGKRHLDRVVKSSAHAEDDAWLNLGRATWRVRDLNATNAVANVLLRQAPFLGLRGISALPEQ